MDWRQFVKLSRRHRVQGLVWNCLGSPDSGIPARVATTLADDASAIARHNLRAAQLCQTLLGAFRGAGIPILFLKGLALSKMAYGNPFLKMGWDVDVLVPTERVETAAAEMLRLNFVPLVPSGNAAAIAKWHRRRRESIWRSAEGLHVELHTRLVDSLDLIPTIDIGSAAHEVAIAPGILLPTLRPEDLFAYLCVHGASSAWFRLKWITDFTALFQACTPRQVEDLYHRAHALGAGRSADQALILASRIYEFPWIPNRVDRTSGWLADVAWKQMVRDEEPTEAPLGTLPIHYTQLFLRPGLHYKIREAARQVADWVGQPR